MDALTSLDWQEHIGRFDDMCPLIPLRRRAPDDMEIRAVLAVVQQVVAFVQQETDRAG